MHINECNVGRTHVAVVDLLITGIAGFTHDVPGTADAAFVGIGNHAVKSIGKHDFAGEIFAFADSCKMGEKHTEEAFLHIIDIHEDYEELIEKYNMTNGRITLDYDYVMKVYQDCVKKGVF